MTIFINAGTRLQCPHCQQTHVFGRDITDDMLPVAIKCPTPRCNYLLSYSVADKDTPPRFPKIPPSHTQTGVWHVTFQVGEKNSRWKDMDDLNQVSYRERLNAIAGQLAGGLQMIESLRFDLTQLANAMTAQLEGEWAMAGSILKYWKPVECEMFLRQPILALPLPTEDEAIRERSKILLHPNFVQGCFGAILKSKGAWYAQVILPYFQYHSSLDPWVAGVCEIPPPWELKVYGNGLVGNDLTFQWKEIPQVTHLLGHTEEEPHLGLSPVPEQAWETRRFLASKGVAPWTSLPLSKQDAFPALDRFLKAKHEKWQEAYQLFRTHGRIALLWENREQAWELALTLAAFCFGFKLGLVADEPQGDHLKTLVPAESLDMTTAKNFHWKVFRSVEDMASVSLGLYFLIIVDYGMIHNPEVLNFLQGFEGRIILIQSDALMDAGESNWEASRFYSTVNCVHQHKTLPPERTETGELGLIGNWLRQLKAGKR